jgi:hypothetical protein
VTLLVLVSAAALHVAVFTMVTWAVLAALGGHATDVAFGTPALFKRRVGETTVSVGPIPTGAVTILGRMADEPATDPHDWRHLGVARRLAVVLTPWLIVFAIAMFCLGPRHALTSFTHGVHQLLFVFDLTPLVRRFLALAAAGPIELTVGLLFAKSTALNLLPFPGLAGGGAILELLNVRRSAWMITGTLVMLYVTVRILYAMVRVLIG